MVDPVNLNVPGLPYLVFALVFLAVVFLFAAVISPIELAVQRHQKSRTDADDGTDSPDAADPSEGRGGSRADRLLRVVRNPASLESDSPTTVYECRRCGTTLEAGDDRCPHCETSAVARYEIG
jgi:hypothetical protein